MSLTYVGLYVTILGALLQVLGVTIATEELTRFVTIALEVVGLIVAAFGRWRQGDVNVLGVKK